MDEEQKVIFTELFLAALGGIMGNESALQSLSDEHIAQRAGAVALEALRVHEHLSRPVEVISPPPTTRAMGRPRPSVVGANGSNVQTGPLNDDINSCASCGQSFTAMPGPGCKYGMQHHPGVSPSVG